MLLQTLPHAGRIVDHLDAELAELRRGPDPGEHQQLRARERARAQHDFATGPHQRALCAAQAHHAARDPPLEVDAFDLRPRPDREIPPVADRRQVGRRAVLPQSARLVRLHDADRRIAHEVDVMDDRDALLGTGREQRFIARVGRAEELDGHRAGGAAPRQTGAALGAPEVRLDIRVAPAVRARLFPQVVVLRQTGGVDQTVDRAAAAQGAAPAPSLDPVAPRAVRFRLVVPSERIPIFDEDLCAGDTEPPIAGVAAGLDQQHRHRGVFRQPRRDDATRRTCTDDDVIEFRRLDL